MAGNLLSLNKPRTILLPMLYIYCIVNAAKGMQSQQLHHGLSTLSTSLSKSKTNFTINFNDTAYSLARENIIALKVALNGEGGIDSEEFNKAADKWIDTMDKINELKIHLNQKALRKTMGKIRASEVISGSLNNDMCMWLNEHVLNDCTTERGDKESIKQLFDNTCSDEPLVLGQCT